MQVLVGKTRRLSWVLDRRPGGEHDISEFTKKRLSEDHLDWLHRLLKAKVPVRVIVKETGLPLESVQYVAFVNGYELKETTRVQPSRAASRRRARRGFV